MYSARVDLSKIHTAIVLHHLNGLVSMVLILSSDRFVFFFSSRRRHTRCSRDWSSDVCSSDLRTPDDLTGLIASLRASLAGEPLRLFTVDPLASFMVGGDENSPRDMGVVLAEIGRASCRERV